MVRIALISTIVRASMGLRRRTAGATVKNIQ
jgi:hypothetical protein